ncbi:MAG: hypothetical protein ACOVNU_00420 [Candidatus Kapaibacteriota bacterium]
MKITNDCVREGTIFFEINGQCISPNQMMSSNEETLILIKKLYEYNVECCRKMESYFNKISYMIEYYNKVQIDLQTKCCHGYTTYCSTCDTPAGQAIIDIRPIPVKQIEYEVKKNREVIVYQKEKPVSYITKDTALSLYYVFPGNWKVISDKVIDSSGIDLSKYMPMKVNRMVGPNTLLECITCYRVVSNSVSRQPDILFTYQLKLLKTNEGRLFEATSNLYKKFF